MKPDLQKAMLIGMYLSKFDKDGLSHLGFDSFSEAFNVIGLAINVKPLSIRNYRDEFDPVFPNERKGWHKRPMFDSRVRMLDQYKNFDLDKFTDLVKRIIYQNPDIDLLEEKIGSYEDQAKTFAKRLITGQAAEQYFKDNYESIPDFRGLNMEDTTQTGCGFDFKLSIDKGFYAIEVKGLDKSNGSVGLTNKEYKTASLLRQNYYIFLVRNFVESPFHTLFRDPIFSNDLEFTKNERMVKQINYTAVV